VIKKTLLAAALLLAAAGAKAAIAAPSYAVDLRGYTYTAEAILAVVEGQTESSIIRVKTVAPSGEVSEELLPLDASAAGSDKAPQVLYDAGMDELMVLWLRTEAGQTTVAVATRPAPGLWLGPESLDLGDQSPASFRAAIDRLSRLHVMYETAPDKGGEPGILHRVFDVITLNPLADPSHPFDPPVKGRAPGSSIIEGGQDDPGWLGGSSHAEAIQLAPQPSKPSQPSASSNPGTSHKPGYSEYGIAAGCSVAVAYRISGLQVEIATRNEDAWSRGTFSIGSLDDKPQVKELVSEIAQRFCWP